MPYLYSSFGKNQFTYIFLIRWSVGNAQVCESPRSSTGQCNVMLGSFVPVFYVDVSIVFRDTLRRTVQRHNNRNQWQTICTFNSLNGKNGMRFQNSIQHSNPKLSRVPPINKWLNPHVIRTSGKKIQMIVYVSWPEHFWTMCHDTSILISITCTKHTHTYIYIHIVLSFNRRQIPVFSFPNHWLFYNDWDHLNVIIICIYTSFG